MKSFGFSRILLTRSEQKMLNYTSKEMFFSSVIMNLMSLHNFCQIRWENWLLTKRHTTWLWCCCLLLRNWNWTRDEFSSLLQLPKNQKCARVSLLVTVETLKMGLITDSHNYFVALQREIKCWPSKNGRGFQFFSVGWVFFAWLIGFVSSG